MTPSEAGRLLAVAAAFDQRTVGEADMLAWADALNDLPPAECAEAIRAHFRATHRRLMPVDVRERVLARRSALAAKERDERLFAEIKAQEEHLDREQSHAAYLRTVTAYEAALAARDAGRAG